MSNAWWDRGERRVTRRQVAVRSIAAFAAIVLCMSISWPTGIAVALVVCTVATLTANRMLQNVDEDGPGGNADMLRTLFGMNAETDSPRV